MLKEVVFHAAGACSNEDLRPVEAVLADSDTRSPFALSRRRGIEIDAFLLAAEKMRIVRQDSEFDLAVGQVLRVCRRRRPERVGPVITRIDAFLAPKPIRYMVSQTENRLVSSAPRCDPG